MSKVPQSRYENSDFIPLHLLSLPYSSGAKSEMASLRVAEVSLRLLMYRGSWMGSQGFWGCSQTLSSPSENETSSLAPAERLGHLFFFFNSDKIHLT